MALNSDLLKSVEGLTEAQIATIITLSTNDEATILASKQKEFKDGQTKVFAEAVGLALKDSESFEAYSARIKDGLKGDSTETKSQLDAANKKVTELEKALKEGSQDKSILQKLADAENRVTELTAAYDESKQALANKEDEFKNKFLDLKVSTDIKRAISGLKFKDSFSKEVQETLIKSAESQILQENKPDYEGDTLVFRGEDGNILRNKDNSLHPFTATDLLKSKLVGALSEGVQARGAGSSNAGGNNPISLNGAKTQIEADEMIAKQLAENGIARGTQAWQEQSIEMRTAANVQDLPVR